MRTWLRSKCTLVHWLGGWLWVAVPLALPASQEVWQLAAACLACLAHPLPLRAHRALLPLPCQPGQLQLPDLHPPSQSWLARSTSQQCGCSQGGCQWRQCWAALHLAAWLVYTHWQCSALLQQARGKHSGAQSTSCLPCASQCSSQQHKRGSFAWRQPELSCTCCCTELLKQGEAECSRGG